MPVPKGFKLPHDQQKYDGSQEPQSWLSDYLQAVEILGGTKETAMQSLQLHLTGVARLWLSKLEKETIGSWEELTKQFTSNFKSTYKWPVSVEEVKACVQQHNETLSAYIQRWSIIKNSAVEVSDERAIDAFIVGLRRGDLVEEMGRIKPKIVSDLMDIANRFADGEDVCNNKRTRSPEDDRENRYGGQRRRLWGPRLTTRDSRYAYNSRSQETIVNPHNRVGISDYNIHYITSIKSYISLLAEYKCHAGQVQLTHLFIGSSGYMQHSDPTLGLLPYRQLTGKRVLIRTGVVILLVILLIVISKVWPS
jgi:hypothetical protein